MEVNKDHTRKVSCREGKERDGAAHAVRADGNKVIKDVEAGDGDAEQKHGRIQEGNHCVCFRVCAGQRYELDTRAKESERSKLNTRVIMVLNKTRWEQATRIC